MSTQPVSTQMVKLAIKDLLGGLPLAPELYWQLRQRGRPLNKAFSLARLERRLPEWTTQAAAAQLTGTHPDLGTSLGDTCESCEYTGTERNGPQKILIFTTLRYWIEHAALMGLALAGLGHQVSLSYLPYANWRVRLSRFDLRRHDAYALKVLSKASPLIQPVSFLRLGDRARSGAALSPELLTRIAAVSQRDVQYTLQVEEVELGSELYRLRQERNTQAACAAWQWIKANQPDLVLTPNGSILEMGAVFETARHLDVPVVTYEFGEQRDRIWLAHNREVMRQDTDALWAHFHDHSLDDSQLEQIRGLYASRQRASLWENFSRRWQGQPGQGGQQARQALGLDERPVALLAANVIGDSLTLGRQVFSATMTEWLQQTIRFFAGHPEMQLVVRVHPGERYTKGPSVADVVRTALPPVGTQQLPEHIHLVEAGAPVNTYDLVEIADLGLVYTTTVGMEMAMSGVPVAVAGQTHYRGRGFTLDYASWETYSAGLLAVMADPGAHRLAPEQVAQAWHYAYRFFFDYPSPFPWHLLYFWEELGKYPLAQVLSADGLAQFGPTFRYLAGEPRHWEDSPVSTQSMSPVSTPPVSTQPVSTQPVSTQPASPVGTQTQNVKSEVREFYDRVGWQEVGEGLFQNAHYEDLRPVSSEYIHRCHLRVKRHLAPEGRLLLDAGSGPIQYPEYLEYSRGYQQRVCADISITALRSARGRIGDAAQGGHGLFVVCDIANLPFAPDTFDGVVSLHTIHHLPEDEHLKAYAELHRVLAPGRTAAVVNGWPSSKLMDSFEPWVRFSAKIRNRIRGLSKRLRGQRRSNTAEKKAPRRQGASGQGSQTDRLVGAPDRSEEAKGTFTSRHDAGWIRSEVGAQMLPMGTQLEIRVWRSASVRFLRALIHPWLGGRLWLRLLYWLEERDPQSYGENGQYPLILIHKQETSCESCEYTDTDGRVPGAGTP